MQKKKNITRRYFMQLSALSAAGLVIGCGRSKKPRYHFPVSIHSDYNAGHMLMKTATWPVSSEISTDVAIVGGGISGLSAAASLEGKKEYLLFELSDTLGGTSSAGRYAGISFSQGAHYDLAYPQHYGQQTLHLLNKLRVIEFNNKNKLWEFTDKKYLIEKNWQEQCRVGNELHDGVLPNTSETEKFASLLKPFEGRMTMPLRLLDKELLPLDSITFRQYLNKHINLTSALIQAIDYQMHDDYGGGIDKVSALAGIHYYTCRPYSTKNIELFSPPQGNYYFIQKLYNQLNNKRLLLNHLLSGAEEKNGEVNLEVIDVANHRKKRVKAKQLIYAGKKHALKYIQPELYSPFSRIQYAPWVCINFILQNRFDHQGLWQNEWMGKRNHFMGFVDSDAQFINTTDYRVFTAYFCLPATARSMLHNNEKLEALAYETIELINEYYNTDLTPLVEKAFVHAMGHAMPVPAIGYLATKVTDTPTVKFAGVDNYRLPLLFEAIDSGITAAGNVL